jgi:hypothetical protein
MKTIYLIVLSMVIFSCQNKEKLDLEKAKQASIDSMKVEIAKQKVIDSMQAEMAEVEKQKQKEVVVVNHTSETQAAAPKKKGWSNTAKGAVIGAGVGAATGAIVSKRKGEGAIIGGLIGAGVGAGTGSVIDEKKKKEQQ